MEQTRDTRNTIMCEGNFCKAVIYRRPEESLPKVMFRKGWKWCCVNGPNTKAILLCDYCISKLHPTRNIDPKTGRQRKII